MEAAGVNVPGRQASPEVASDRNAPSKERHAMHAVHFALASLECLSAPQMVQTINADGTNMPGPPATQEVAS